MKPCTRCGIPKFVKNRRLTSGRGSRCLSCVREVSRNIYLDPSRRQQKLQVLKNRRATSDEKKKRKKYRTEAYSGEKREIEKVQNRDRVRQRRAVVSILKEKPCRDCEKSFPPCCMDFDHVRGQKFKGVGQMVGQHSLPVILSEISKCDLVCACCHRVRTWGTSNKVSRPEMQKVLDAVGSLKKSPCVDKLLQSLGNATSSTGLHIETCTPK
jgi:hypothetical protein